MISTTRIQSNLPGGILGPNPGARPGGGACWRVPGGQAFAHGTQLGPAQSRDMDSPSNWPTTHRRILKCPVLFGSGSRSRRGPWQTDPWLCKLAMGPLARIIKSSIKVKPPKTKMGLKNCTKIPNLRRFVNANEILWIKLKLALNYLNWLNSGMCVRLW